MHIMQPDVINNNKCGHKTLLLDLIIQGLKSLLAKNLFKSIFISVSLLLLSLVIGCDYLIDDPHPSDKELIANFQSQEEDFDTLIKMANEDSKVVRIGYDFTWLDNNYSWPRPDSELGFSKVRWEEYRRIFKKLHLEKGIAWYSIPDGPILLLSSTRGLATGGSEKGFAFSTNVLSPLFGSLDGIDLEIKKKNVNANVPVYRQLKNNWYLYYKGD
jgi:hypothetical protein